ncbi:nifR3 family TIM-barrel protein [Hydrogenispora ethanolica]|uniref:tRNA-dihydrouridine synthase n=1 Tax=Hydrogenispora ethanolica TaxID=1082276 RepID=A0A4R1S7N0_HYDET|nr:tRNA dihydrouridine synthase DusB [Hydrogenispora ethanolica]TCL75094.1 nifR3 family TIM-barrel protein [Hydrogenispora ethanolica]
MLIIGTLRLENPVVLAPMAGVGDPPFRRIVKQYRPGLLCAEMVSAAALHFKSEKTYAMIRVSPQEKPLSMQIFGSDPVLMAEAAQRVAAEGADIIDINMGCPVPKVVSNGEGSALMNNLPLAAEIIRAVAASVAVPVTVKFRLGWDDDHIVAPELARLAETNGAAAVTLHARTRNQFYQGRAAWEWIARVKRSVAIPVIGNGDVDSPQAARRMIEETGCDGVMIGQAALGRPWLLGQAAAFLTTGELPPDPSLAEQFRVVLKHLRLQVEYSGELRGIKEMRKHFGWYFKGVPGSARLRERVNAIADLPALLQLLREYAADLGVAPAELDEGHFSSVAGCFE